MVLEAGWSTYLKISVSYLVNLSVSLPLGFPTDCEIVVEPNLAQTTNLFHPSIMYAKNSTLKIKNIKTRKTQVKRNYQTVVICRTDEAKVIHHVSNCLLLVPTVQRSAHAFHAFSKDLATESLYDVKKRVIDNIKTPTMEAENT